MASAPHTVGEGRATAAPLVLPITSRGLAVTDRVCWAILGVAMAVAAALILYLGRGTTYYFDEIEFLYATPGLDLGDLLEPHNGHLIATTRLAYKAILETLGPGYVPFRLLALSTVLLSTGLFYALVKRSIGALPALAPTLVLLFLGSAWQHVAVPIGFTPIFAIAAGLAALLALERTDRRGDVAACALLVVSVATYSSGLPFLVGVAISVLIHPGRKRRAWIFLVPLALYAAWWLWSLSEPSSVEEGTKLSNFLLIPAWSAEALASDLAAVFGLSFNFSSPPPPTVDPAWGRVLGVIAVGALALRIRKGNVPVALWVSIGIVLTWWALGGFSYLEGIRTPTAVRYIYLGSLGVLLVAAAAAGSIRFSRLGLAVLFGVCAISLATNVELIRKGAEYFRAVSTRSEAEFAMIELARDRVDPAFEPANAVSSSQSALIDSPAGAYLGIADRYGSLALSLSQLEGQPENVRDDADQVLAAALALQLGEPTGEAPTNCTRARATGGGDTIALELPSGGATLRANGPGLAEVTLGRFGAAPTANVGSLPAGETRVLEIPPDASPRPWHASLTGARSVTVCPLE